MHRRFLAGFLLNFLLIILTELAPCPTADNSTLVKKARSG
jgi:hypothetical protein